MNKDLVAFEDFLKWFVDLPEVFMPEQQKYYFLEHLEKTGYLDEKADKFIEELFDRLDEHHQAEYEQYSHLADMLKAIRLKQENPDLSLKSKIVKDAEKYMMTTALDFKDRYKTHEKTELKKEETTQTTAEEDEVARLKELVGA